MVRRALTRQTRRHQMRCSTFKITDFIVEKPFWKILEFWPLETSILTWAKKWLKWFLNYFSQAFERCLSFFSTPTRSRDHGGAFKCPPPPSRWLKIQRPSRARVKLAVNKTTRSSPRMHNNTDLPGFFSYIFTIPRKYMGTYASKTCRDLWNDSRMPTTAYFVSRFWSAFCRAVRLLNSLATGAIQS